MSCGTYVFLSLCLSLLLSGAVVQALSWGAYPTDKIIAKGGNVKFNCEITDLGNENVIWSKDGAPIFIKDTAMTDLPRYSIETVTNGYNLQISNIIESDAAEFSCTVQGLGIKKAKLDVLVPPNAPTIAINNTNFPLDEGDKVSITCSSSGGNPPPTFVWKKKPKEGVEADIPSGKLLLNQENPQPMGVSSSQIVVAMDYSDHEAVYRCVVYNQLNQDSPVSISTEFRVYYAPRITFRPFSTFNILRGNDYQLECEVNANPPVTTVTWRKGSQMLSGTSKVRSFINVQKADSGEYSCTAQNTVGGQMKSDSKSIQVNVLYKPIVTVPKSVTANSSGDVSVLCEVDANPPVISIRWTKTDNSLEASGRYLNLSTVHVSQMGNYSCIARNRLNLSGQVDRIEETKAYTFLYVQYKPGEAAISRYTPVMIGSSITLSCSVNDPGYPTPKFEWKRLESNQVLPTTSASLTMPSVTLADIGNYTCTPYNLIGRGVTAVVSVDIFEKPTLLKHPEDKVVIDNSDTDFSFHCRVRGRPKPKILWYKDGTPLGQYGDIYTVTDVTTSTQTHSFLITSTVALQGQSRSSASRDSLLLQDIGNYTCLAASNETNYQDSHTMQLLILFPPKTDNHQKVAANLNDTSNLVCITEGYPVPQIRWYKGESLLTSSGRFLINAPEISGPSKATSALTISSVEPSDFDTYRCVVDNSQGSAEKSITLTVKNKPEAPSQLEVSSKTWESVYLRWSPGFDGGESQTFYIYYTSLPHAAHGANDVEVTPGGANRFNVTGLMPNVMYDFRVYGVNKLGQGKQSNSLKIATSVLPFPRIKSIPVFVVEDKILKLDVGVNNSYCLRIRVSTNSGLTWTTIIVRNVDCFDVSQKTFSVPSEGIDKINVSLCLRGRQDVCGSHISAEIRNPSTNDLSEPEVIAIGCVCAAILLALLGVLIYIICRRRQRNKEYENSANANRPTQPVNGATIPPAKPKRGLDNPDSGPSPTIYPSHPYSNHSNGVNIHGVVSNGSIPLDTSYDSQLEKRLYENEMNRRNANMSNNGFNNTSPQGTPRKDPQQFINLPHDDSKEGGSIQSGMESGYSTPDPGKPKQKKVIYEVVV